MQYMGLSACFQLTHFSYVGCENTCTLPYYHFYLLSFFILQPFMERVDIAWAVRQFAGCTSWQSLNISFAPVLRA